MTLRDYLEITENYDSLREVASKRKTTNSEWEDDLHDFIIINLSTNYSTAKDYLSDFSKYRPVKRKTLSYVPEYKFNTSLSILDFMESNIFNSAKVDIVKFIEELNNKQLPFHYRIILTQYLKLNLPFKELADRSCENQTTYRYKLQKAFKTIFLYLFNYHLNISNLKIMSIQKIKPGYERLAYLINMAEEGRPFVASEFMKYYRELTNDHETQFVYKAGFVKEIIAKVKDFLYEEATPLTKEVSEELVETLLESDPITLPELESFKLESDSDFTIKSNTQRGKRKNGKN
jgi:hypothetical protein